MIGRELRQGKAGDQLPINTKGPILPERPTLLSSPCVSPRKLRHKIASTEVMDWEPIPQQRIVQAQLYEEAWTAYARQNFTEVLNKSCLLASEATQLASQLLEALH